MISPVRLLIIPGLHDSGPGHWQTWLQARHRSAVRVCQQHWDRPDLERWSERISATMAAAHPRTTWIAVAHSFGCLALVHHLQALRSCSWESGGVAAALLVAPADPVKFQVESRLPDHPLPIASTVVASETDPWMTLAAARAWADRWQARVVNMGPVGHINTESGFGAWPWVQARVDQLIRDQLRAQRLDHAHPLELNFAV